MKLNDTYSGLQDCIIKIRHYSFPDCYDKYLFENAVEQLKIYEQYIVDNQLQSEHQILLYCIKTLLEIISENDKNKIYDFADTIHNIPEIYLGKRGLASFSFEITNFCNKYGNEYFAEIIESSKH